MMVKVMGLEADLAGTRPGHVHLVGIGGAGMSAIAWVLLGRDYTVSGSDLQANALTDDLAAAGATIYVGHAAANIAGADTVVISSAVPATNPELVAARAAGVPILKRADFLGQLMAGNVGIAVAGTHGKTTTTGMIAQILLTAGRDPSVIVGGVLPALGRNGRAGQGAPFVIEADEYDYMFLGLQPRIAVVTNVEHDHPDIFATPEAYLDAFRLFVDRLPAGGRMVACADDAGVQSLLAQVRPDIQVTTYGLTAGADLLALEAQSNALGGTDFVAQAGPDLLGLVRLRVPGEHNVRNALAALAVAEHLEVPFADVGEALAAFGGVSRRFQLIGQVGDIVVIDDYAHHPTEIRATLAAARQQFPGRRLWAVWQPHTFSRTRLLLEAFAASFDDADRVVVLDIYRSREQDSLGVSAADVVARMEHPHARYVGRREEAAAYVLDRARPGDVILTLGAGDGNMVGQWVLDGLREAFNRS